MMNLKIKLFPFRLGRILAFGLGLAALLVLLAGLSLPVKAASLYQLTPFPTPTADADGKIFYIVQEGIPCGVLQLSPV